MLVDDKLQFVGTCLFNYHCMFSFPLCLAHTAQPWPVHSSSSNLYLDLPSYLNSLTPPLLCWFPRPTPPSINYSLSLDELPSLATTGHPIQTSLTIINLSESAFISQHNHQSISRSCPTTTTFKVICLQVAQLNPLPHTTPQDDRNFYVQNVV